MSADYIAPLGFDVDTAALVGAQKAADATAQSLDKMGVAAEKAGAKSKQAADGLKQASEATRGAGQSAGAAGANVRQLMEILQRAQGAATGSGQAIQNLTGHMNTMAQTIGQGGAGGLSGSLTNAVGLFGRLASTLGPVGGVVAGVAGGVAALGAGFAGLVAATGAAQDRFALLEGRLKNVYGSATTAKQVLSDITSLANKNAVAIDQTAESFLRLARNNEAIGLSRKRMVELTDAVQMLGRVSGASTGELASGMLQFSQALASGRLNGDELRSIMENMPALAKAIAQGLGVTVGQLRAMGAEGELTGDKITKALLGQLPEIRKEFESLPQTTEQAFTRVGNAWDTMLTTMGTKLNSSRLMQYFAAGIEGTLTAINDTIRDETPAEARARIYAGSRPSANFPVPRYSSGEADAALYDIGERSRFEGMLSGSANAREARDALRAPYNSAQRIFDEVDPARRKVQEITSNIQALRNVYKSWQDRPDLFSEQEVERIARIPAYIGQLQQQLQSALPAFDKFKKTTADAISDAIKYGYQGAGIGGEVRSLMAAGQANGQPVSEGAAYGAVIQKRIFDTNAQIAAIMQQVEAEKARAGAIGQGKAAEREAEASSKAYEWQLQHFGATVTGDAKAAVEAYKNALLGLSVAQDAAAAKQAMLNAQIDLSAAKAGAAAAAAGGGPGAVAEAQRNARRAGQLATSDDPASLVMRFAAEDIDRRTGEAGQLRNVRQSAAMQRRVAGGMSPAAARQAQQEQEARQFSEGFSSGAQRELAYQAKIEELRARDAANARQRIEERRQSLDMMEREAELTKTGSLEERVAIARAREMNAIRAEGVTLSQDELNVRLQIAEAEVRQQEALDKAKEKAGRYKQMWDEIGQAVANSLDSAFEKMLDGQKVKFKDFAQDLMKDLAMILIRNQITGPLASGISSMGKGLMTPAPSIYGSGGVFSAGHAITMFASGGLVASPTLFPMARGAGLMGEAGPEAVLPLKRGPDGRLGVAGGNGASNDNAVQVVVNDMRGGGERVETQEDRGPDGKRFIRLTIRDEVKGQIKGGNFDPEMSSQYGARRMLARR